MDGCDPVFACEKRCGLVRLLSLAILGFAVVATPCPAVSYDYPFVNPYEATVIGTPSFYQPKLPEYPPVRQYIITVFANRKIPDVLWYSRGFRFSLVHQRQAAPLIFVIAGTGSSHESPNMRMFQRAFYDAGFHVLSIASPTHPNFIINASTTSVPGHLAEDSRDIYRVMKLAFDRIGKDIDVSSFHLTGYSLGGAQAAMVSKLDETEKRFGFRKVLLINPPVSLLSSVDILDRMLEENLDLDPRSVNRFFGRYMRLFSEIYKRSDALKFDEDFLFDVYKLYPQKEENLATLIGLSFRNASTSMIFVADVMSQAGFVVPPDRVLGPLDSLTDYHKVLSRTGFTDYVREFFLPFYRRHNPDLSMDDLVHQLSLKHVEAYLRENASIGLLHNEDDVILADGELEYLKDVFGSRAKIFPTGGHLGNLAHEDVLRYIIDYFGGELDDDKP